ncbi:hypothetical protein V6N13_042703 [Hibiscus sabdariffa]
MSSLVGGCIRSKTTHKKSVLAKSLDGRSFKEVLLSNMEKNNLEVGNGCHKCVFGPDKGRDNLVWCVEDQIPIVIKDSDKDWLRQFLIVQISGMYDSEFVRQILQSEGFKVIVSCWFGFYDVIRFEEEEHIDIFLDLKDTLLKPWISDIDYWQL